MNPRRLLIVILLAVALAPATALAHGEGARHEPSDQDIDVRFVVRSTYFAELNMDIEPGEVIEWSLRGTANNPVITDLHAHDMSGTVYFHQNNSTSDDGGTFTAGDHGVYSIAVYNAGARDATVRLKVQGFFAVVGTEGFTIEEESPSANLAALAAALALAAFAVGATRRRA